MKVQQIRSNSKYYRRYRIGLQCSPELGNRSTNSDRDDHTYTNFNMMTDSPGSLHNDNDVLGNRTWREKDTAYAWKYVWDSVNRMTQAIGYNGGATYKYRADGMRVKKVGGYSMSWNPPVGETGGYYTEVQVDTNPTYRYFYDGQMPIEDDYTDLSPAYNGTRYGLGARGIDFIQTFAWNGSSNEDWLPHTDLVNHFSPVPIVIR